MSDGGPTCSRRRKDGGPCGARALPGKNCCTFHDPDLAAKREAGRRAGGKRRSQAAAVLCGKTPDAPLSTVADVAGLLGATINQVRRGELDPKVGNCVGLLAGQLARCIEGGDLERRVEDLEKRHRGRGAA